MTARGKSDSTPVVRLRDLHPTLRLRLAVAFVERALNTMVIPLMAIYLTAHLGAGPAGLLILVSVGVAVTASLFVGHIADVVGRRLVLLTGALVMAVGFTGMAVAASSWWSSPLAVFMFYLLQAAAAAFIQPVHDAVIIDVTVPEERKAVYAINYWSFNIALAAGILLAGFLYEDHFISLLVGASMCTFGAGLLTYLFLQETAPPVVRTRHVGGTAVRELVRGYTVALKDRRFMLLLLAMTLILGLEMQRTSGYVAVRVAGDVPTQNLLPFDVGLPHVTGIQLLGILNASNTVCVVLLALVSERLMRRLDDRRRILIGVALFTGACVIMAVSDAAAVLLLAILVLTLGELMHIPVMQTVLAGVVPEHLRTKYMAIFNLNIRGGMAIASLTLSAGTLLSPWGIAGIYVVLGLCAMMIYLSLLSISSPRSRQTVPAQPVTGSAPRATAYDRETRKVES